MGRTNAPVTTIAVLAALCAVWHFTGGMHGTVLQVQTPPAASAITTAVTTTQCEPLPGTTSSSASPSAAAGIPQLCVGVQAAQTSVKRGKAAAWTIDLQAQNGPATSVTVTLTTTPAELAPAFTTSCPSGSGTATCTVGDMGTAVTPSSYQLQAQVTVPAGSSAANLTLSASADTSPSMTGTPAAGQTITITGTSAKPTPARTAQAQPTPVQPATQPAVLPVTGLTAPATNGDLPTVGPVTTTVAPGSVTSVLPQITPVVATAPAPAATAISGAAANVQALGNSPTQSSAQGGDSFSISIGMSAQTAQILGWILLALVTTLAVSKLIGSYFARARQPRQKARARLSAPHFPRLHLPRLKRGQRPTRAERRTTREQNWRRYLENQQPPASDPTASQEAPQPVIQNPL